MHFDFIFDLFRPQNRCSRVDGSSILEKATIPLPSSIFSPKMLPKGDPKHPKTSPERPKSSPRAPRALPRGSLGALWSTPGGPKSLPRAPQASKCPSWSSKDSPPRPLGRLLAPFLHITRPHLAAIRLDLVLTSLLLQSLPPLDKISQILADRAAIR